MVVSRIFKKNLNSVADNENILSCSKDSIGLDYASPILPRCHECIVELALE